ncbi:hypothetical protein NEAUS04_1374 [Nematocida ausubeli]|nr:hypothetical protein NEAUS07_1623 [Nematocida ausubeli]KAI5146782.1 hypothetical protein NEAUS05_0221 [Nematocida ausubeli]KAI5163130.1 hypothetical protein NEAUS04_1374 [Nematocida ausubeli]
MEEYMQKRIISFGVLGVGAALILFPVLMNLYYMFTCEVELRNRGEFQAYYTTSSGGDANQLNTVRISRFEEPNPTEGIYSGRAYIPARTASDNYFDGRESTFENPLGTNYRQSSARGSGVYRPTTYTSNNDEREYDEDGLPAKIYHSIKYKLAFYIQLFGLWHMAIMCLGIFIIVIGLLVFRESILMQERTVSFCGVDRLIYSDVEQIANPIHTEVKQMNNSIHTEVKQMDNPIHTEGEKIANPIHTEVKQIDNPIHTEGEKMDNPIHTEGEKMDNPIHTEVEKMDNPIHTEVEQMATEVTLEKPQLETLEPTEEICNENEILNRLERGVNAKPERPCITKKQWEDMVEAHDKKYSGIAVDLAIPSNLC